MSLRKAIVGAVLAPLFLAMAWYVDRSMRKELDELGHR